jgi:hypothetical protein
MRLLIATASVLLTASVAHADGTAPSASQPVGKTTLVCRALSHDGDVLKGKDCRTREEWDRVRQSEARWISDFQNRSAR